jgi:HEAT repeat protein
MRHLLTALISSLIAAAIGLAPTYSADAAQLQNGKEDGSAPAVASDAKLLEAARAADIFYQQQVDRLVAMLSDDNVAVRIKAIGHIGNLQDPSLIVYLLPWMQASNRSPDEINAAINALPNEGAQPAIPVLKGLLKNDDATIRVNAMNSLTRLQSIDSSDYTARAKDDVNAIRGSSLTNLGVMKIADAAAVLTKGLASDGQPHIRRMCAISLGLLGDPINGPALTDALTDSNPGVRRYAAEALVKINYTRAIPHLLMAMEANVAGDHIARCLTLMTKQDFGFHSHDNAITRNEAVEKGFTWWTANSKELNH